MYICLLFTAPQLECTKSFTYGLTASCDKYCKTGETCWNGVCDKSGSCICDMGYEGEKCDRLKSNMLDFDSNISGIQVLAFGDITCPSGYTGGKMAAQGNLSLTAYSVGYHAVKLSKSNVSLLGKMTDSNELVAGGYIEFNGGSAMGGNFCACLFFF
eukprot:TRINITY_DN104560_c0_g1_i1.p1 TRINITY_DN104560_c0_g1~~TRINITY_DN104560_c0_g1_i1.p1  ORF type:complete len:157 (+),score=42.41 TRINITY_DN104560_c0_g1_i1:101-571(+)